MLARYQSLTLLARIVVALLVIDAVLHALNVVAMALVIGAIVEQRSPIEIAAAADRYDAWALGQTYTYWLTGGVFVVWCHRAYANTLIFDHDPEHGLGWAIGGWFVPIINLYRPFTIMREIWNASAPRSTESASRARRDSLWLAAWWAAWVGSTLAFMFPRLVVALEFPIDELTWHAVILGGDILALTAALLAIGVVRGLTARQEARSRASLTDDERAALRRTFT